MFNALYGNDDPEKDRSKLRERRLTHIKVLDSDELTRKFYRLGEVLGKGSFGTVVKATQRDNGLVWAIKIILKDQTAANRVKLLEREIRILKLVQHPNIIHLERVLESPKALYLVFELCRGALYKLFKEKKHFSEPDTRVVIRSLSSAVAYLHQNDIVHRDLKLENIMMAINPQDPEDYLYIKVTDFGLSVVKGGIGNEQFMQEKCGTLTYMAPELIDEKMYSNQCDVWSIGVIMYLLLSGVFPFDAPSEKLLCDVILYQEPVFNKYPWLKNDKRNSQNLIHKMLAKNPAFRITAAEIENSSWVKGLENESENNIMELMGLWKKDMMEPMTEEHSEHESLHLVTETMRASSDTSERPVRHISAEEDRRRSMNLRKAFGEVKEQEKYAVDMFRKQSRKDSTPGRRESQKGKAKTKRDSEMSNDSMVGEITEDSLYNIAQPTGGYSQKPHNTNKVLMANTTLATNKPKTQQPLATQRKSTPRALQMAKPAEESEQCYRMQKCLESPTASFGVVVRGSSGSTIPSSTSIMHHGPPIIYERKKSSPRQGLEVSAKKISPLHTPSPGYDRRQQYSKMKRSKMINK